MPKTLLKNLRADLRATADEQTQKSAQRFFKEEIKCYGVKSSDLVSLAKRHWGQVKGLGKEKIFALVEDLLASGYNEEAFVVAHWLPYLVHEFVPADMVIFRKWIDSYIDNWAKCDTFCNHTVGGFIGLHPELAGDLLFWAKSPNRWLRRAAAVSLIIPAKHGKHLTDVFALADTLLMDKDDMVQKGYGWLLKEASRLHQAEVLAYVMKHRDKMPRTALRYAIELMPENDRCRALGKKKGPCGK